MIKVGSDFSGVGAFNQALRRLNIKHKEIFACDMDKYARQTFVLNYGEPEYYPTNVYEREIPAEPLDIYMTSPPCQAFSLAGKRKGEDDKRGVLFYNSHEFIQKNKPRYFIFENVKGLLSDDNGKTFQRWIDFLGGKTVNGNPVIFPHEESVPYHVYYQVLNAKHYGIPQNRERIFIIGIRDDADNDFGFPKPIPLEKRLLDVLESEVDEKYFLSDKMLSGFMRHGERHDERGNEFAFSPSDLNKEARSVTTASGTRNTDNYIDVAKIGYINQDTQASQVISENGIIPNICAGTHGYALGYVETSNYGEFAAIKNDVGVICFGRSESEKQRRKETFRKTGKDSGSFKDKELIIKDQDYYDTLLASPNPKKEGLVMTHKKIRRLTPTECFRLMDFNENFKWDVSDSQAYKQAGNSICVGVLAAIISKLKL